MYLTEVAKQVKIEAQESMDLIEHTWKDYTTGFFSPYKNGKDCLISLAQPFGLPIAYSLLSILPAILTVVSPLICGYYLLTAGYNRITNAESQMTSTYLIQAGVNLANTLTLALFTITSLTVGLLAGPLYAARFLARTVATGVAAIKNTTAPELQPSIDKGTVSTETAPLPILPPGTALAL